MIVYCVRRYIWWKGESIRISPFFETRAEAEDFCKNLINTSFDRSSLRIVESV